jgi:hypothetical protein
VIAAGTQEDFRGVARLMLADLQPGLATHGTSTLFGAWSAMRRLSMRRFWIRLTTCGFPDMRMPWGVTGSSRWLPVKWTSLPCSASTRCLSGVSVPSGVGDVDAPTPSMRKQPKPTTKNSQASPPATRSRVLQQNPWQTGNHLDVLSISAYGPKGDIGRTRT